MRSIGPLSLFLLLALSTSQLAAQAAKGKDLHGDPLPPGVLARLGTIRFRPGAEPQHLAFTPDSKQLICFAGVYGTGNALVSYDVPSGKEIRRVEMLDMRAHAFTLLPDGRGLALVRLVPGEEKFYLWEFTGPKSLPQRPKGGLQGRTSIEASVFAISPDGKWLATAGRPSGKAEKPIQVWPWSSGKMLKDLAATHTWKPGDRSCEKLLFTTQGELLAFCFQKEKPSLLIFDLLKGKLRTDHPLPASFQMRWHNTDARLATHTGRLAYGPDNDHARILDLASGKELHVLKFPNRTAEQKIPGVAALAFSADGRFVAVADWEGWLRWWDIDKGKAIWEARTTKYGIRQLTVSPDGRWLASGGSDAQVRLWSVATGNEMAVGPEEGISTRQAEISADGKSVFNASYEGKLTHWDLSTGKLLRAIDAGEYSCLGLEPGTGRLLVTHGKRFDHWDVNVNRLAPVADLKSNGAGLNFCFAGDGKSLVLLRQDSIEILDWPARTLRRSWPLTNPAKPKLLVEAWHLVVNHDCSRLHTSGMYYQFNEKRKNYQGQVFDLWDARLGVRLGDSLNPREDSFSPFNHPSTFMPDQEGLVITMFNSVALGDGASESLRLLDATTGKVRRKFLAPANPRNFQNRIADHVAVSPDGRTIASAERDHTIVLYEAASGLPRRVLHGHRAEHSRVAFTPDGRKLVSFNSDLTGLVWDLALASAEANKPTPDNLLQAWNQLTNNQEGAKVHQALATLAAAPSETVALIRGKMPPTTGLDPKHGARLIADLDSTSFPVRDKAYAELDRWAEDALILMREHLAKGPPLEVVRRLERLVEKHDPAIMRPERLREIRAVEVLEHLATVEARRGLAEMAKGAPTSRRTQDAAAAARRLQARQAVPGS